jgi:hypothetical protein
VYIIIVITFVLARPLDIPWTGEPNINMSLGAIHVLDLWEEYR